MLTYLEALPLALFLLYIRQIDTELPTEWQGPFVAGGIAALGVILLFLHRKQVFNRLLLGINLYLISGGLAFITHQWWLNRIYCQLQASGMLLWIIATGIASLLISSRGFIGVDSPDAGGIRTCSFYLLLVSILAFALSFGFRGNPMLSETVPFLGLFLARNTMKTKLGSGINECETGKPFL